MASILAAGVAVLAASICVRADIYDDNKTGRGNDNFHCNRQCRWAYGSFERSIQGEKHDNGTVIHPNPYCSCSGNGTIIGTTEYYTTNHPVTGPPTVPDGVGLINRQCCQQGDNIPWGDCTEPTGECHSNVYPWAKPFDQDYWADKYTTNHLCVRNRSSLVQAPFSIVEPDTMHEACMKDDAAADAACQVGRGKIEDTGLQILHCGKCSACSALDDMEVLYRTRSNITTLMTKCSTSWVISQDFPHAQTLRQLKECLVREGIAFSDDGRGWEDPQDRPSCMDTWTDNILNDAQLCTNFCLTKFIHTKNSGNFAKDACLQCDEFQSGPAFIKGAGANRRSAGIVSDIDRSQLKGTKWEQRICKIGHYSNYTHTARPHAH